MALERNAATDNLLARIKRIEQPDGSWPGGDTVSILCEWFTDLGYDINAPLTEPKYEGQVIYADGSRICLQCYDGNHEECTKTLPADYPSDLSCECCGPDED